MPGGPKYRAEGRCVACGGEREEGKMRCTECLVKGVECRERRRQELLANRQCVFCRKPNDRHPKTTCLACAQKMKIQRAGVRMEVIGHYSNGKPSCACCGETIPDFLTIDHVNEDGAAHRKKVAKDGKRRKSTGWKPPGNGVGVSIYRWLKKNGYPPGFQVLCMSCNFAKGHFGSCPHTRENPYLPTTELLPTKRTSYKSKSIKD